MWLGTDIIIITGEKMIEFKSLHVSGKEYDVIVCPCDEGAFPYWRDFDENGTVLEPCNVCGKQYELIGNTLKEIKLDDDYNLLNDNKQNIGI